MNWRAESFPPVDVNQPGLGQQVEAELLEIGRRESIELDRAEGHIPEVTVSDLVGVHLDVAFDLLSHDTVVCPPCGFGQPATRRRRNPPEIAHGHALAARAQMPP